MGGIASCSCQRTHGRGCARRPSVAGFTIVELLSAIALLGVLLAIGVPSFQSILQNNRAATVTNQVVSAVQVARSEAVKRGRDVEACRSTNGSACTTDSTNWTSGWLVRTTLDDGSNAVLKIWEAPGGNISITGPAGGLTFSATGAVNTAQAFTVRPEGCSGDQVRTITVSGPGFVTTTTGGCS